MELVVVPPFADSAKPARTPLESVKTCRTMAKISIHAPRTQQHAEMSVDAMVRAPVSWPPRERSAEQRFAPPTATAKFGKIATVWAYARKPSNRAPIG